MVEFRVCLEYSKSYSLRNISTKARKRREPQQIYCGMFDTQNENVLEITTVLQKLPLILMGFLY